jgi:hypothetical protein
MLRGDRLRSLRLNKNYTHDELAVFFFALRVAPVAALSALIPGLLVLVGLWSFSLLLNGVATVLQEQLDIHKRLDQQKHMLQIVGKLLKPTQQLSPMDEPFDVSNL